MEGNNGIPATIDIILKNNPKLKSLNHEQRVEISKTIATYSCKTHIGPLPDPETLKGYSEIIPDGANRILIMAENQANHRMKLESNVIKSQMSQSNLGQILAFIIGMVCIISASLLIYFDKTVGGSIIGGAGVTSLVTAFIKGKSNINKDLSEKR